MNAQCIYDKLDCIAAYETPYLFPFFPYLLPSFSDCKGEMLLSDSQISMRPLCLNMMFTLVDSMFVIFLKK